MCIVSEQKRVNMSLNEGVLERLDAWASGRGISRSRAVEALLDLATGETESREQREARAKGLLVNPMAQMAEQNRRNWESAHPGYPEGVVRGRVIDDSEEFKQ